MTIQPPRLERVGDVYTLKWDIEKIKINIDHIAEEKHAVWGEFVVSLNTQSKEVHLHHGVVNLLATTSKNTLTKQLEARDINRQTVLDWGAIVEQACMVALRAYREGEPIIQAGNLPERTTPRYMFYPYILMGEISAFYGFGGSGKSFLATFLALAVQCNFAIWGVKPIQGNVLYLDWEASSVTFDERVKALKTGMGIESNNLVYYRRCHHRLSHDISEVQRAVAEKNISLVIIDSVGMASGIDQQFHSSALEFLRAARSLGISVLCIDHKPKGEDSMFGSVYKTNECRSAFDVRGSQTPGDSFLDVGIFHRKMNDGPLAKARAYRLEFEGDQDRTNSITLTPQDITQLGDLAQAVSCKERILRLLLTEGKMTSNQIAEALQEKEDKVRTTLNRYKTYFLRMGNEWGLLVEPE